MESVKKELPRIGSLIGFGSILIAVGIVLVTPPANEYEISIYGAYPGYFWASLIVPIFIGQILILHRGLANRAGDYWKVGVLLMVLPELLLVYLPIIREYHLMGRGDPPTHIGYMKDIVEAGVLSPRDIYPALHEIGVTLSYATGLSIVDIINVVPPIITLLYFAGVYGLVTEVFGDSPKKFFILPLALLLVFSTAYWKFTPFLQSTLLSPLVLFLYFKYRNTVDIRIFSGIVVMVIAIVLFHPLTSLYLVGTFLVGWTLEMAFGSRSTSLPIGLIGLTSFTAWYFGFVGILIMISITVYNIAYGAGESSLERYGQVVSSFSPELSDLVQLAILRQGFSVVVSLLAGAYLAYILLRYVRTRRWPTFTDTFFISILLVFGAVSATFFFFDVVGGYGRPLTYGQFFALIAAGAFLQAVNREIGSWSMSWGAFASVIFAILLLISVFSVYHSPLERRHNHQTTEMELNGGEWLFSYQNEEHQIVELGVYQYRLHDMINGYNATGPNVRRRTPGSQPPDHFGYGSRSTLGASYPQNTDTYLIVTKLGRITYMEVFPEYPQYWRFTPENFQALEDDPTTSHVYDNGDFDTYVISGTNTSDELVPQNTTLSS